MEKPTIPDYDVKALCGSGAYGDVWLCMDRNGIARAVKTLDKQRLKSMGVLQREEKAIQLFRTQVPKHRNLIEIFHIGETENIIYYVMELADNIGSDAEYIPDTLENRLKNRIYSSEESIFLISDLLDAVQVLDNAELAHRDIKPSNIIFVDNVPRLADIGLVASTSGTMSVVGTMHFMPPDSSTGNDADLYSMGKILYCVFTGRPVQDFPTLPDVCLSAKSPVIMRLNKVAIKACSKIPENRFKSVSQFKSALLGDPVALKDKSNSFNRFLLPMFMAVAVLLGFCYFYSDIIFKKAETEIKDTGKNDKIAESAKAEIVRKTVQIETEKASLGHEKAKLESEKAKLETEKMPSDSGKGQVNAKQPVPTIGNINAEVEKPKSDPAKESAIGKTVDGQYVFDHKDVSELFGGACEQGPYLGACTVVGAGASWNLNDVSPGTYVVIIKYSLVEGKGGGNFDLYTESSKMSGITKATGKSWGIPVENKFGEITVGKDDKKLSFKVVSLEGKELWALYRIKLVEVQKTKSEPLNENVLTELKTDTGTGIVEEVKPVDRKMAEVEGAEFAPFQKGQSLISGKKSDVWMEVPETLNGMLFSRYLNRQTVTARVKILEDGLFYMAVTTRWSGKDNGEDWQKECLNDTRIKGAGWKEAGRAQSSYLDWIVYSKNCRKGEVFSYRTEKYVAPVIMVGVENPKSDSSKVNAPKEPVNSVKPPVVKENMDAENKANVYAICDDYFYFHVNGKEICYSDPDSKNRGRVITADATLKKGDVITVRCLNMGSAYGFACAIKFKDGRTIITDKKNWKSYTPQDKEKWSDVKGVQNKKTARAGTNRTWRNLIITEANADCDSIWGETGNEIAYLVYEVK